MENAVTHNNVKEVLRDSATTLAHSLRDAGMQVADSAKQVASDLSTVGTESIKSLTEKSSEQLSSLEDTIRKYPIQSLFISAGVGILLSRIVK